LIRPRLLQKIVFRTVFYDYNQAQIMKKLSHEENREFH
jgi:hypothetical protein